MIVARECNLHSGITKSCGCLQIERTKKQIQNTVRQTQDYIIYGLK